MKKLIRWFNDFRKGYVRLRCCEKCGTLSHDIHWTKNDHIAVRDRVLENKDKSMHDRVIKEPYIKYDHVWLCDFCFYNPKKVALKVRD